MSTVTDTALGSLGVTPTRDLLAAGCHPSPRRVRLRLRQIQVRISALLFRPGSDHGVGGRMTSGFPT
jgi:hypothetical protein